MTEYSQALSSFKQSKSKWKFRLIPRQQYDFTSSNIKLNYCSVTNKKSDNET